MTYSKHKVFSELRNGEHGKFAESLAEAWFYADSTNQGIIEAGWPMLMWKSQRVIELRELRDAISTA